MPEQQLYALHQPVPILPAQCLCQPIEGTSSRQPVLRGTPKAVAAGNPAPKGRQGASPRMLQQPKLPQHIGRGKRFQPPHCGSSAGMRSFCQAPAQNRAWLPARKAGFVHRMVFCRIQCSSLRRACLAAAAEGGACLCCAAKARPIVQRP